MILNQYQIILIVVSCFAAVNCYSRDKSLNTFDGDGDKEYEFHCLSNFIDIKSAEWTYKKNFKNFRKPNLRTAVYPVGNFVAVGTWNVLEKIRDICQCNNQCNIQPNNTLPKCGDWDMHLIIKWKCVEDKDNCIASVSNTH